MNWFVRLVSFSTARLHASSECSGAEISVNGHSGRDDRRCCIASDADRRSDVCSARHVDEKGLVRLRNVAITADDVFGKARIFLLQKNSYKRKIVWERNTFVCDVAQYALTLAIVARKFILI